MAFLDQKKQQMDLYIEGALTELADMMEDLPTGVDDDWSTDPDSDDDWENYPIRTAIAGLGRIQEFIQGL